MGNRKTATRESTPKQRTRVERLTEALEGFNVACACKVLHVSGHVRRHPDRIERMVADAREELLAALTEFTAPMLRVVGTDPWEGDDGRK